MARYTGPKNRLARREGVDLFLKSVTGKQLARDYAPGQHGQNVRGKTSNYGYQLREKQKVKRVYGILEKQFRGYFKKAARMKGVTGAELLKLLERRLDNVVFRSGFTMTRSQARQLVSHGHILVNDAKVNIPSYQIKMTDVVKIKIKKNEKRKVFADIYEKMKESVPTDWLNVDNKELTSVIKRLPERSDIKFPIEEQLIVELYSK